MSKLLKIFVIFLVLMRNQHQLISTTAVLAPDVTDYPDYEDNGEFIMLMSGGYRPVKEIYNKYIVSIRTSKPTAYFGDNHFCAGTIISARLIVTAAHCIKDSNRIVTRPRRLVVVAGTPNRLEKTLATVELEVEQVLPHEEYIRKGSNDIALLRLKMPIPDWPYNDFVNIIPLRKKVTVPGENCTAIGWGQLFYRGPFAADLVYIDLEIMTYSECEKFYPSTYAEGMLCATNKEEEDAHACGGDSGGPLICDHKLAGIVAWGARCEQTAHATVFTDVFYHLPWIETNDGPRLRSLSCCMVIFIVICCRHLICH